MKRALFLLLAVFVLVSLSCNFATSQPTEAVVAVPVDQEPLAQEPLAQEPVAQDPAAQEPAVDVPAVDPTEAAEVIEPADADPTPTTVLVDATVEPTATAEGPIEYKETFDRRNDLWSDPLVVTTQAGGREPYIKITVDGGVMRFAIQDKETYVYKFFNATVDGNGSVEAVYEPHGAMNNSISIVCRVNDALTSWYEVRIISHYGEYNFYRYDKKLKTEENKNPYVLLGKGRMAVKEFSSGKSNTFKVTCTEDTLIFDINKGKKIVEQPVDEIIEGNIVGIGVQSYDVLPVAIDFDTITITQE